ncbi:hypothetical protein G7Y89_g19 [Cudoniella acicularis]|uniref:DUF6594 domain-containing protein n=1 Tax=Cudoniella acicularis TaxID=354080 RepID=A0A8H4RXZ0_9HELO|nr:hypothetical protein G7Y89_g19 [Cudoniella acicularis]
MKLDEKNKAQNRKDTNLDISHEARSENSVLFSKAEHFDEPAAAQVSRGNQAVLWWNLLPLRRLRSSRSKVQDLESQKITPRIKDCPAGYPRVAALLDSDENFMLYRRFGFLQARVLLHKQDQLRHLELKLDQVDKEDEEKQPKILKSRELDNADDEYRTNLLNDIEEKFKEYASFSQPPARDYRSIRSYFDEEAPLCNKENYIYWQEDIVTLKPGREYSWLDSAVEKILQKLSCRPIRLSLMACPRHRGLSGPDAYRFVTGDDPERLLSAWPWLQIRGVLPPRLRPPPTPPDPDAFSNIIFNAEEEDEEIDLTYEPSETSSEEFASDFSEVSPELTPDLTPSEISDLRNETWMSEEWCAQKVLENEILALEELEDLAPTLYDPDEVVSLITEFYELIIKMGPWPKSALHYAPHTSPPIDREKAKELGFDEKVIDLMEKLPYLDWPATCISRVIPESDFADYRNSWDLQQARKMFFPIDDWSMIESHMLPLVKPSTWYGRMIVLDTKLGVIRAYACDGPPIAIEWLRPGNEPTKTPIPEPPLDYYLAPCIPAAQFLRNMIDCYHSLDRVPFVDHWESDPDENLRRAAGMKCGETSEKSTALKSLYLEYGWPDNWRREEFLHRWKEVEKEL